MREVVAGLSTSLGKPIIVSQAAARRRVIVEEGARSFEGLVKQLALIWYSDGHAIYLYDSGEIKNSVIALKHITVHKLQAFLERSGLQDARYPIRGDGARTLYVSGPPIYVDLVLRSAQLMDRQQTTVNLGQQQIGIIHLVNTFVGDRRYEIRDDTITLPGMATVIENLLKGERGGQGEGGVVHGFPLKRLSASTPANGALSARTLAREVTAGNIRVMAYPDTNSLLIQGRADQVRFIESLVMQLDEPKRRVELSLWVIDLQQSELKPLGLDWQETGPASGRAASTLTLVDADAFIEKVAVLERRRRAHTVARPVILTQENVPAIFDNNRTFYSPVVGAGRTDLQHITFGTLVSVLPRFVSAGEIEVSVNIEEGRRIDSDTGKGNQLPTVDHMRVSSVARIPGGRSLLVTGFSEDESTDKSSSWMGGLLGGGRSSGGRARVFLIQPREIRDVPLEDSEGPASLPLTPEQRETVRRAFVRMAKR